MNEACTIPVNINAAKLHPVSLPVLTTYQVQADMLRLDLIHPVISGNKWFKLRYHLEAAILNGQQTIITFGGAYSNHVVATACICRQLGIQCAAIIRGEEPLSPSGTLRNALSYGMELLFAGRDDYALKQESARIEALIARYHDPYIIPEGGSGENGIRGCSAIAALTDISIYSHIMCCIGTGTMFTGLSRSMAAHQRLVGIPVLKLQEHDPLMQALLRTEASGQCDILPGYHFGGYAKKHPALIRCMNDFYTRTGIPTDFVYTGKLIAAFLQLVQEGYFPAASRILLIHSGGLQGNNSLPPGTLVF